MGDEVRETSGPVIVAPLPGGPPENATSLSQLQSIFSKKRPLRAMRQSRQNVVASIFNPFKQVTQSFIMTFGITPPRPEQELKATIFICTMLLGTVVLVIILGLFVLRQIF
jgi:hypothetical protein